MADVENGAAPEHHEPAGPSTAKHDGQSRADGSSFAAVYRQIVQVVKQRFERTLGSDVADEIAAKAGMSAWKEWQKDPRSLADPAEVPRYANKVATNLRKNALRDRRRADDKHELFRQQLFGQAGGGVHGNLWSNAEARLEIAEFQAAFGAVLETLTPRARDVGELMALGYDASEIAEALNITLESARAHERRVRQAVLTRYGEDRMPRSRTKRPRMAQ